MVALSRSVSSKHAMELLLTGEVSSAQDALRFGLVNRVVPGTELRSATDNLAQRIASRSSDAIRIGKQARAQQAACRFATPMLP